MIRKAANIILRFSAKIALKRNSYKIVAITGSTGKTSTKKAISLVLTSEYSVLSSEGEGYNTEIGVPLTLIQKKVPRNKIGWFFLILESPLVALKKRDYEYCILEMGADKPGDIEYLIKIAKPNISVVTNVSEVHLINFKNIKEIAEEKEKILSNLRPGGVAILNNNNQYTKEMKVPDGVKRITFGKRFSDIQIIRQDFSENGSSNYFQFQGKDITINSVALGGHVLYIFAAALAVGVSQKINIEKIIQALEYFRPTRGRLNIIEGINNSTIIDDSYNANPSSMKNALDVLGKFKNKRRIALLGSMNELGDYEMEVHEKIGKYLVSKCDILVTVGEIAGKYLASASKSAGLKDENVYIFDTAVQAGEFLQKIVQKQDIILVKGSQNKIRVEKAVKILMENPEDASKVLCRQTKEWENRS